MKSRKNIIIAAAIAILGISVNSAFAESNNLIQMDVKKSSVADTVDVTFYTTMETANSVATRKSSNRYVVLLPNTASSASVAPNFGAVRDLITDIDVKHVNDGMGGYTKVTFGTTKPINIKTHMAKTAPLSQAQKDARALIAKNNTPVVTPKPAVTNTNTAKPTQTQVKQTSQPAKTASSNNTSAQQKPSATPKIMGIDFPKVKSASVVPVANKKVSQPKPAEKAIKQQTVQPKKETAPVQSPQAQSSSYTPKMKYDKNGKRIIDLEPRVNHSVVTENANVVQEINNVEPEPITTPEVNDITTDEAVETPGENSNSSGFPFWILYVSGSVALLGILYLMYDAAQHSAKKDKSRLDSFFNISAQNHVKRRKREYYDIVNNEELNWQEKYKLYNQKEDENKPQKHIAAMSYVTDMSGLKKPATLAESTLTPEQVAEKNHKEVVNEKVKAKMLELEKSYNAPSAEKEISPAAKVHSEDDVILKSFNEIKLKSFSKPMSLKENQRGLISADKDESRNKSYKDGKFVKLKTSQKVNNKRNELETTDLINTGDKYLQKKGVRMSKERESYLVSSVDEYLSILDTEKPNLSDMSAMKMPTSEAMVRSGVSNPISSSHSRIPQTKVKPAPQFDGLVVKSGYNIDTNRGFFVVNIDGVSAIVGKVKENIFILKKFDRVIENPLQVRRDDGNVYIVRLGRYKCLVNVEQDKMGTLIEI